MHAARIITFRSALQACSKRLEVSVSWNFTGGARLLETSAFLFDKEDREKPSRTGEK